MGIRWLLPVALPASVLLSLWRVGQRERGPRSPQSRGPRKAREDRNMAGRWSGQEGQVTYPGW